MVYVQGGFSPGLAPEPLLFTVQWPPRPWSFRTLLGPFVIPGRAVCVSINQSPVDHVSRRHQRVLRSLKVFVHREGPIFNTFSDLYFPSGRPWALSALSQKHFENTSLENSIFSRPLTASSKVLPRAWRRVKNSYWCTVWHRKGLFFSTDVLKDGLSQRSTIKRDRLSSFPMSSLT